MTPTLYFDLASPYAYFAVERSESVLGRAPELEPVLLGAIFKLRGWGSWAATPERDERIADILERARRYGLARMVWPAGWPTNSLAAMRAATWAKRHRRAGEFARAIFHAEFHDGEDIADVSVLSACAARASLDPEALPEAIASTDIKEALRQATQDAWDVGVRGVPTLRVGETVFYGDDQLERAAQTIDSECRS